MSNYKTTYHRDGTITYWHVHSQAWKRVRSAEMSAENLATMSNEERAKIERHAASYAKRNG